MSLPSPLQVIPTFWGHRFPDDARIMKLPERVQYNMTSLGTMTERAKDDSCRRR